MSRFKQQQLGYLVYLATWWMLSVLGYAICAAARLIAAP